MKSSLLMLLASCLALAASLSRSYADQRDDMDDMDDMDDRDETAQEVPVGHHTNPQALGFLPSNGAVTANTAILHHGGAVMATPTVYVIWYGNWNQNNGTDNAAGKNIVTDFLTSVGGSPYYNLNTSLSIAATKITGMLTYGGATVDTGSQGTSLTDAKIKTVVTSALSAKKLPTDANGIYLVLTSSDVNATSGFCTRYCGWHTHATISAKDIKYSFVGNAARCITGCAAQSIGPNGNAGVDGMISVIAHEIEEATTDPDLNAWYDSAGAENADKCAWTFGQNQYQTPNGAWANMHLGSRDYLIQRNLYKSATGDYCATGVVFNANGTATLSQ
ncbi:MAG: hypothetical protein WCP53_00900 [Verrucomicrobiota bacterium]